jgi:hypothetical protein
MAKTRLAQYLVTALLLSSLDTQAAGLLGSVANAGSRLGPGNTDSTPVQSRTVEGFISRARILGTSGSSAVGGPRCEDLIVSFYLQNLTASQGRFLASVVAVDTNVSSRNGGTVCAYRYSNAQTFPNSSRFKRWFAVVNERGPVDNVNSCYQQAYADLGSFASNVNLIADINLVETCPLFNSGTRN